MDMQTDFVQSLNWTHAVAVAVGIVLHWAYLRWGTGVRSKLSDIIAPTPTKRSR